MPQGRDQLKITSKSCKRIGSEPRHSENKIRTTLKMLNRQKQNKPNTIYFFQKKLSTESRIRLGLKQTSAKYSTKKNIEKVKKLLPNQRAVSCTKKIHKTLKLKLFSSHNEIQKKNTKMNAEENTFETKSLSSFIHLWLLSPCLFSCSP